MARKIDPHGKSVLPVGVKFEIKQTTMKPDFIHRDKSARPDLESPTIDKLARNRLESTRRHKVARLLLIVLVVLVLVRWCFF